MVTATKVAKRRSAWIVSLALFAMVVPAVPSPIPGAVPSARAATAGDGPVLGVSAGDQHSCAIRTDGALACWGRNGFGEASPPSGTFAAVSVGADYSCGIRTEGTLACWGWNGNGEATPPAGTYSALSAGTHHACAIRSGGALDGTLACWGWDDDGQASPPAGTVTALSAGERHTCAIATDDTIACWGSDWFGQATPPAGTYLAVTAGASHTCAIRGDGTLACWGWNGYGQATPPAGTYSAVSAGASHTCAIPTDGTLACWGRNEYGQATPPAGTYSAVSAGASHTCAIPTDATLACWGNSAWGQTTPRPTVAITALPTWLATNAVALHWSGTPLLDPVVSYEVRYRRARWDGGFGPFVTWLPATAATSATFPATSGYTYCFEVRARDAGGFVSYLTSETCAAIALDDRALSHSASWVAGTGTAYYRSTYLRSSTYGAWLTRTGVKATRIALLATTCSTCGTVRVYLGSVLLRSINLHSATTVNRKLFTVATFPCGRSGTLVIKVTSSGKRVIIDGVAIRRN